jgi:uncharacterized lipoprotein NlpE involved in copper resistance
MKPFRLAAISLALLTAFTLVGCDNSDDKPQASAPAPATASSSKENTPAKPDSAKLAKLASARVRVNLSPYWMPLKSSSTAPLRWF